jgi:hypothetical protein
MALKMSTDKPTGPTKRFDAVVKSSATKQEEQISELQEQLAQEKDARMEDRFVFIVAVVILLDVVFFTVMPSFGGPLALLILQLLVLIPLAKRMGVTAQDACGCVTCKGFPARVRRMASSAPIDRRRAVSMTERMSA